MTKYSTETVLSYGTPKPPRSMKPAKPKSPGKPKKPKTVLSAPPK